MTPLGWGKERDRIFWALALTFNILKEYPTQLRRIEGEFPSL